MPARAKTRRIGVWVALGIVGVGALSACSQSDPAEALEQAPFGPCGHSLQDLRIAAEAEGELTLLGSPRSWADTGAVMDAFTEEYGITFTSIYPDSTSGEELTLLRTWAAHPRRPDVADLTPAIAVEATEEGLVTPYRSSEWATIPARFKSADGAWQASYLGVMSFGVDRVQVPTIPKSWHDLQEPEYSGMVTINGDPRESGTAAAAVFGATLANGGTFDDVLPGIEFFSRLKAMGNLNSTDFSRANLLYGDVPIGLDWNFSFVDSLKSVDAGNLDIAVVEPSDGLVALPYAQVISSTAMHPCAARLWIDFLNSDQAAVIRNNVNAISTRYASLPASDSVQVRNIEAGLIDGTIGVPTVDQLMRGQEVIDENWGPMVVQVAEQQP